MAFTVKILSWLFCHLNIVGCLLTRRPTKGGSQAPQDPPSYAPGWEYKVLQKLYYYAKFQLKRLKISLKEITS